MIELFANDAQTTLNGAVAAGDGTVVVASAAPFPALSLLDYNQFRIRVEDAPAGSGVNLEFMAVTLTNGTTFTVARGQDGTAAIAHASGSVVTQVATAGALNATTRVARRELGTVFVCGNSYARAEGGAATAGASAVKFRYPLAVAKQFGASEHNVAVNGAIMHRPHLTATGDGGYADILQGYSPSRVAAPYLSDLEVAIVSSGLNDLATLGVGAMAPWVEASRRVLCRLRAGAVFEDSHASVAYSAGFTAQANTVRNSGAGYRQSVAVGDTATITVPADFPGGELDLGLIIQNGQTAAASITVDGSAAGQPTVAYGTTFVPAAAGFTGVVKRLTGLAAGAHTIVITTTAGNTFLGFDSWEVAADTPPLIAFPLCARVPAGSVSDADVATFNTTILRPLASEFLDGRVFAPDIDTALAKAAVNFNAAGDHPNDRGHQVIASLVSNEFRKRLDALDPVPPPSNAGPLWHMVGAVNEPGYQNGWGVENTAGYMNLGFRRSADGRVYLQGLAQGTTNNVVAFTLPDGYRPATNLIHTMAHNSGAGIVFDSVIIGSDGTVTVITSGSTWTNFTGISFQAA